jgi:hypothetical protein
MELLGDIGRGVTQAFAEVDKYSADMAKTSGTFTVNKDNVLAAAKIIETQAVALDEKLRLVARDLRVVPPGNDDVSIRVASAWNDILLDSENSYQVRIAAYIEGLRNLAQQCADSARTYGYSDDEIAAAFRGQGA